MEHETRRQNQEFNNKYGEEHKQESWNQMEGAFRSGGQGHLPLPQAAE